MQIEHQVGHTLWMIQALEKTLVHFIVLGTNKFKRTESSLAEERFTVLEKFTMGSLVSDIIKNTEAPPELKERLSLLLQKRNWFVHKSWSDHYEYVSTPVRLAQFFSKLNEISEESVALNERFGELVKKSVVAAGVSEDYIEEETRKILAKWFEA